MKPTFRNDGSPQYMYLRMTPKGAAIAIQCPQGATLVRVGHHDFWERYRHACRHLCGLRRIPKRASMDQLNAAGPAFVKRYGATITEKKVAVCIKTMPPKR